MPSPSRTARAGAAVAFSMTSSTESAERHELRQRPRQVTRRFGNAVGVAIRRDAVAAAKPAASAFSATSKSSERHTVADIEQDSAFRGLPHCRAERCPALSEDTARMLPWKQWVTISPGRKRRQDVRPGSRSARPGDAPSTAGRGTWPLPRPGTTAAIPLLRRHHRRGHADLHSDDGVGMASPPSRPPRRRRRYSRCRQLAVGLGLRLHVGRRRHADPRDVQQGADPGPAPGDNPGSAVASKVSAPAEPVSTAVVTPRIQAERIGLFAVVTGLGEGMDVQVDQARA